MSTMYSKSLFSVGNKISLGIFAALLFSFLLLQGNVQPASAAVSTCLPNCPPTIVKYVHNTDYTNTTSYYTDLNNPNLNNNPQARLIVTANWTPLGDIENSAATMSNIGVWYHNGRWAIFNEDHQPMPTLAAFNVYAVLNSNTSFVQTATAANSAYNFTDIDNPLTNNQPGARLFVTQNWNPNGSLSGQYDNHPVGVWYHNGKWSIFNEDGAPIPANASFNVLVQPAAFIQTATAANLSGDATCINNASLNGNTPASMFVTPNWYLGSVYVPHALAAEYHPNLGEWCINNLGGGSIPVGAAFNVFF